MTDYSRIAKEIWEEQLKKYGDLTKFPKEAPKSAEELKMYTCDHRELDWTRNEAKVNKMIKWI